jgi:hypothetical protein
MVKHARAITPALVAGLCVLATSAAAFGATPRRARPVAAYRNARTPIGMPGQWRLVFDDEFNGNALNQDTWDARDGWPNQNNVTAQLSNISVGGGDLVMQLASADSGAEIATNNFSLAVGEYAEARIKFAGNGSRIDNWPAWWTSGPNWPADGEHDIAEGVGGSLTINYHGSAGALNTGTVRGVWANRFHTYGIYRGALYSLVFWDGRLVRSYPTDDDGAPEMLLFTMGYGGNGSTAYTGASGEMVVDYVRAWAPA